MNNIAEAGLLGPDSVSWRVQTDPAVIVGGLSALFLQALHPLAMAGVFQHSSYADDFWPRFQRTVDYVNTVNFGTVAEVESVAAKVRRIHSFVRGTDPVTGLTYSADDPKLITWVHVTEVHGFVNAVQRAGLKLSAGDVDRYYQEQVQIAGLLGGADVPDSASEVENYLQQMRPELVCSPATRDGARLLLAPPMSWKLRALTPAQPGWAVLASLGFCLMPSWARRLYRLPGWITTDIGATIALRGLRRAALQVPERQRLGPTVLAAKARGDVASATAGRV